MIKNNLYLIPNVTNAANVGDEAMLEVLIDLINKADKHASIVLHSTEPESHKLPANIIIRPTLYYWAAFQNTRVEMRIYRTLMVVFSTLFFTLNLKILLNQIYKIEPLIKTVLEDFRNANKIVFVGGGYLRSKKGFTQSLNLIFLLLPFLLTKNMKASKIISPISIGPFAHNWNAKISAFIIKNFDLVGVREVFSYNLAKSLGIKNLYRGSDHALFLSRNTIKTPFKSDKIKLGYTIRNWLSKEKQANLEQSYIEAIKAYSNKRKIMVQPIIQVDAPEYGEGDMEPTNRVATSLKNSNIETLETVKVTGVQHGKEVYANLDLLIGMRMHSNILAATQGTLFLPVSYEYKTEGIANDIGLDKLCIKCSEITVDKLSKNLEYAIEHKAELEEVFNNKLSAIQAKEEIFWLKELAK